MQPSKIQLNAYLLEDAQVGGDPGKSLKPIKNVLVWPLENISPGSKAKGIETRFTGVLIDTLTLRSGFERVVILEEDQAKDLMTRAGEELGLKKKPKAPLDGALIATKLGQLSGTECIFLGRIEDYDEDKVDKATITVTSASFNLIDAREKAYPTIDSFTPVKRVWRTHIKRTSNETPFAARKGIDDTFRLMLNDVVDRLTVDLGQGVAASGKAIAKRVAELSAAANKSLDAGEFDKATAAWNEVLKLQPENKRAKAGIEEVEKAKREAQEREKAAALKKQIEETKAKALEAEKAEDLEGALAEWKKILELDPKHKQAADEVADLEKKLPRRRSRRPKRPEEGPAEKKAKEEAEQKGQGRRREKGRKEAEPPPEAEKKAAEPAAAAAQGQAGPAATPATEPLRGRLRHPSRLRLPPRRPRARGRPRRRPAAGAQAAEPRGGREKR